MPHHARVRWRASLAAVALVLAGCSSSGEDADDADVSTTAPTPVSTTTTTAVAESGSAPSEDEETVPDVVIDHGVTEDSVRIGLSLDLTGPRADLSALLLDAHGGYADATNAAGGIAGRRVELVGLDHGSDLLQHMDNLDELAEESEAGVVVVGAVESGEFAAASLERLDSSSLPLVQVGAAEPPSEFDAIVRSIGLTPCRVGYQAIEVAIAEALAARDEVETEEVEEAPPVRVAILTADGVSGLEGGEGASLAARAGGAEVVFEVIVADEVTEGIVLELVAATPEVVWVDTTPAKTAQLLAASTVAGVTASWWGPMQGWDPEVLGSTAAAAYDERFTVVAPVQLNDATDDAAAVRRALPDAVWADLDQLLVGWYQAQLVDRALGAAAEEGDLRRANVAAQLRAIDGAELPGRDPDTAVVLAYDVDAEVDSLVRLGQAGASPLVRRTDLAEVSGTDATLCR